VSPGVGKRSGVDRLLEADAEAWAATVAFGDDYSDIELLEGAGYGYAMANAAPEVAAVGRYRAGSNEEDGVAIVLERLIARMG
jgi:hydroxymethylpyrimidine pyrophosphatase-like HAD family hydrolase